METKVVSFSNEKMTLRVIVGEETAIARMRRSNLRQLIKDVLEKDLDNQILHTLFYPDCIAAVVDWCGMDKPTYEQFALLPAQFVDDWAGAVWELNPQWEPKPPEKTPEQLAVEEKKESTLINDSLQLSDQPMTKKKRNRKLQSTT